MLFAQAAAIFAIAIYGGYFGAAAGVVLLAMLLRAGGATLAHANAAKNVMLGASNLTAAVVFAFLAPVHWAAVVPLGLRVPARVAAGSRRGAARPDDADADPHRRWRALALAVKLGIDAYT